MENGLTFDENLFPRACETGRVELVKYLMKNMKISKDNIDLGYDEALKNNHARIVNFLRKEDTNPHTKID